MLYNLSDLEVLKTPEYVTNIYLNRKINKNVYLSIVTTNDCQLSCPYCINGFTDKSLNMPFYKGIYNIKQAKELFNIEECVLLGGEPLLYDKIFELIVQLNTMKFNKICLTTNGLELGNRTDIFDAGLTHINISIHYDNNKFGITELAEFYDRIKTLYPKLQVRVNTNVYRNNHDTLSSLSAWISKLQGHCDTIRVSNIIKHDSFSVNSINNELTDTMMLSDDEYNTLFNSYIDSFSGKLTCITNFDTLGFVRYTLIPLQSAVIINHNTDTNVEDQICENADSKINTLKCLVTGDISLSWNTNDIINLPIRWGSTENGDPTFDSSWTKNIQDVNLIITKGLGETLQQDLVKYKKQCILHLTCTGAGNTNIEPNVPDPLSLRKRFENLLSKGFNSNQCVLRIDPIIDFDKAVTVLDIFKDSGIIRVKLGFMNMDNYDNVESELTNFDFNEYNELGSKIIEYSYNNNYPYEFETCSGYWFNHMKVKHNGCLSKTDLDILKIKGKLVIGKRNRKNCLAPINRIELLNNNNCQHNCQYCFLNKET